MSDDSSDIEATGDSTGAEFVMDEMSVDLDFDGVAETTVVDFYGDGVADAIQTTDVDTGVVTTVADLDGDGFMETYTADYDADGVMDEVYIDTNGDGIAEYEQWGESPMDALQLSAEPLDPSVTLETADPFAALETELSTTELSAEVDVDDLSVDNVEAVIADILDDTATDGDDEVDPFAIDNSTTTTSADDDAVHGEPMADIEYHQAQPGDYDCVPTSVAMILSEVTGETVDAQTVVDTANEMGVMTPTGMYPEDAVSLFAEFGVEANLEIGTLDDLRTALDDGTEVVIALDADDLYGVGDEPFADDVVSGHAVTITGIDDDAGLVYINDPGFSDGAGTAIPIDQFEDAWVDMGNQMVTVDAEAQSTDADLVDAEASGLGAAAGEAADGEKSLLDFILLPISLAVRA